jgi:alkylation response protein AidB-like acyl-CoA dehydrogenase
MGWPALLVDEARGGAGGTLADLTAVVEACARHATGLPLVRRCALAPALLMAAASPASTPVATPTFKLQTQSAANHPAIEAALRALCAGTWDIDVAGGAQVQVAPQSGGGVCLSGALELVDATFTSSHVLVPTPQHLLLLPREVLPAIWPRQRGLDGRCTADVMLEDLALGPSAVLASGNAAQAAARTAADLGALVAAIEMAGTLGALVEHCIAHLSTRVQFGVALATFQVLRHGVVELYVPYEAASVMLARLVADTVRSGQLSSRDAAMTKLYLNDLARRGAEAAIQLHGGMGMTTELQATRLAQRLIAAQFEHGERLTLLDELEGLEPA